jgi:predicted HicB family RNase H-like nuclease
VITFEADDPLAADRAFTESIDDYLAFCEQRNESPEMPRS